MPRRGILRQRSATEWGVRIVLALVAAGISFASLTHTLAYALRMGNPVRAHELASYDGRITATLAAALASPAASIGNRQKADILARLALQQDPTAVVAVSTLGINAQINKNENLASRLFIYSQKLSRRDLQTQVWAIEDAVKRNDVSDALRHYDIALRTSNKAADILFPILTSAISDPVIRKALIRKLAKHPIWEGPLVDYLSVHAVKPLATAQLFMRLQQVGVSVPTSAQTAVVKRLISDKLVEEAWSYYVSFRPRAVKNVSRDPLFTANPINPAPFDWTILDSAGISASIQRGDHGGVFDFAVPSSLGGPLLQQMQLLPVGQYRLEGHASGIDQPAASRPYWTLVCNEGQQLGRIELVKSSPDEAQFMGRFQVPAGCPVQILTFVARSSDAVTGLTGRIDRVQLSPLK